MNRQELDRILLVTRHFHDLKGLRQVPFGCFFLVLGWFNLVPSTLVMSVLIVLTIANFFLPRRIERYYRERFGEAKRRPVEHAPSDYWMIGLLTLVALLLMAVSRPLVVARFYYVSMGSGLLGQWLWMGGHRSQGYKAALGTFLMSLTPASVFLFPVLGKTGIAEVLCGAVIILAGLLDHRQLVLVMGPPRADLLDEASSSPESER